MVYTYRMKCYLVIKKKNEIVLFSATWVDPDPITLSDFSQPEKD